MEVIPMEELANGTSRRADGGRRRSSSNSSHAPTATITHDMLEVVAIDVGMETSRITQLYPTGCMGKVPLIMRNDEKTKGFFDPRLVSLGPYHHGKKELQMAEKIKPIVAQLFISASGRDMAEFRWKVLKIVDYARSCYQLEGSTTTYTDKEFAEMMLLDGLFVLAFIECNTPSDDGPPMDYINFKKYLGGHSPVLVFTDIFCLLENQLPFQVLELLMSFKSHGNKLIITMIDKMLNSIRFRKSSLFDYSREVCTTMQPRHCLEHFWLKENESSQSYRITNRSHSIKHNYLDFYHSFRSISELKARGIHARPSSSFPTRTITFKSFFLSGVLVIPPLILDPLNIITLANQIAYECTPNNPTNQPTMVFVNFMKSLIDSAEDVKELRSKKILFSTYSSDEEVVKMFSSIPTFGVEDCSMYGDMKDRIQKHYNSKAKTWFAEFIHNHFSSPWTSIAFFVAIFLLILSFSQTYFTIFPRSSKQN